MNALSRRLGPALFALLAVALTAAPGSSQERAPIDLSAKLAGTNEIGGGAPGGTGSFTGRVDLEAGEVCYSLQVSGLTQVQAAHIHRGAAGANGRPVVTLDPPAEGSSEGCASASAEVLLEISQNPSGFYVNVHSVEFPGGAVRGQLETGPMG